MISPKRSLAKFTITLGLAAALAASAVANTHQRDPGAAVYGRGCLACHGADGAGAMPGVPDLSERDGPLSKPDKTLLDSILNGLESGASPIPMPAKGGDDSLSEAEARLVLDYIRREFGE